MTYFFAAQRYIKFEYAEILSKIFQNKISFRKRNQQSMVNFPSRQNIKSLTHKTLSC
jgi:hypothetical protein